MKEVWRMGNFPFEPCRDDLIHSRHLPAPAMQLSTLQAMLAQVQEELQVDGSLLPQDSADSIRATIWRVHEGLIREATLAQVNLVYSQITTMGLASLVDKIMAEEPIEVITDEIREDIHKQVRGQHAGLIAKEKTCAYEEALKEARSEALKEVHATGAREAAQKGQSYKKMLLSRAEDEARIEADKVFNSHLMSEHSKIVFRIEAEIKEEHCAALEERRLNLQACLAEMDRETKVKFIHTQALCLGLLKDLDSQMPNPSKQARLPQTPRTAPKVLRTARSRTSSVSSTRKHDHSLQDDLPHKSALTPSIEPSPCLAAGEDDTTLRGSPACMDWSELDQLDPLPSIDFEVDTRSCSASIHVPGNEMVDNSSPPRSPLSVPEEVPQFIAHIRDPESVAPPSRF
jgi:hypothetical protein